MKERRILAAGIALVAAGLGTTVQAAEDVKEMQVYQLDDVVVTATRTEKRAVDVPAAATVITAEQIAASGAASAADVLAQTDGFIYKSLGVGGMSMGTMTNELTMRGMKDGALVLVNGNPVAWRGKYNLDAIPAGSIERIEIVRGSGAVLYGSEAVGGVVNIITKKRRTNAVQAGIGDFGRSVYGISVGDERFGFTYGYDRWGRAVDIARTYPSEGSTKFRGQMQTDLRDAERRHAALTYQVNPRLDLLLNYTETRASYIRTVTEVTYDGNPSGHRIHAGDPYHERRYTTQQYVTQLNYKDGAWKGSLCFNTGTTAAEGRTVIDDAGNKNPMRHQTREKNTSFGLDVQRTWQAGARATAVAGVSVMHDTYAILPAFSTPAADRGHYARNTWGLFGQWEQRFDTRNTGIIGLRETWTSGTTKGREYSNLSASAQWLHKLDTDTSLYLNVSQSFVMPTFGQMYVKNARQQAAPGLQPARGITYEIGWKRMHGAHTWRAALFHMDVRDNITASKRRNALRFTYMNEDFRNTGIELSGSTTGRPFSCTWGATWQNPVSRSTAKHGRWDRTQGRLLLTGGITYRAGKWTSALSGSYLAGRVHSSARESAYAVKPYFITQWNTSYAPDETSEISLAVQNVLRRHDSTTHTSSDYYTMPASYMLRYSYKF